MASGWLSVSSWQPVVQYGNYEFMHGNSSSACLPEQKRFMIFRIWGV